MGKRARKKVYSFTAEAHGTYVADIEADSLQDALAKLGQASWSLADVCEVGELVSCELPDGTVLEGAELEDGKAP